ncbi:hypothetical protein T492DRAFT_1020127 [Pavlovales sp. CCMP2436]|nr:hypothetical protein T492DRAFT_1020127 [Pavlovales sp. CCMP2436]
MPTAVEMEPADPTDEDYKAPPLDESAPLRVGLLIEPTPFTHVSGYANRFNEMLRFLRKAGDEVSIVTPDDTVNPPTEAHGFRVTTIAGFRFPLYPLCLSIDLDCGARRMIEECRPALLHASSPSFLMAVALALSKLYRIPLMLSYHTHLPIYAREYLRAFNWFGWLERAAWAHVRWQHNRADLTLTTSPQLAQELRNNGVLRVEVWPKGVDTIKFDPSYKSREMRDKLGGVDPATGEDRPLLLYVGRVCDSKRLQQLRHTLENLPETTLAIVGGGPSLARFQKEFADLVASGRVRFLGIMKGAELSSAFASADVFVMPSDSETLGFVVLESMASGVPPVGVRAGGVPDLIEDGVNGVLAQPGDEGVVDFTEQVRKLVVDKELRLRMGLAARAEAERWSWEAATSMLRNRKYRKAIELHEQRMAVKGVATGAVQPRSHPRVVVWAVTILILSRVFLAMAWELFAIVPKAYCRATWLAVRTACLPIIWNVRMIKWSFKRLAKFREVRLAQMREAKKKKPKAA